VVFAGGGGTGKTTLALQIASHVAKAKRVGGQKQWSVIFLGLEQHPDSLKNVAASFAFGGETPEERSQIYSDSSPDATCEPNKVMFCRLSPLPLSKHEIQTIFETRFAELQHIVLKQSSEKHQALFIIDTLNAFTGEPLTRSQLYQLFSLFRAQRIPLIVTLEQPEKMDSGSDSDVETACFLADIIIRLTREPRHDYLQFFIEVSKSRVCRQGLGKHLYKTRTAENVKDAGIADRKGIVVYPSVHFIISQTRDESGKKSEKNEFIIDEELHNIQKLDLESPIKTPACFALHGPAGTHKLALGLNLGICYVKDMKRNEDKKKFKESFRNKFPTRKLPKFQRAKLLVITFGGQGEIDFKGVAWLQRQSYLSGLRPKPTVQVLDAVTRGNNPAQREVKGSKAELKRYTARNYGSILKLKADKVKEGVIAKRTEVAVLTFQIGVLTPEECIYRINKELEKDQKENPFHSVLISDTAELCTGFPLLSKDPMFFAALLDLFESKQLLTVGLGVLSTDSPNLGEINLILMAKATHRMRFYHYPEVEELMKEMVNKKRGKEEPKDKDLKPLTEQRVSVVIDNVTGKHYKREPKWIQVDDKHKPKLLKCLSFKDLIIDPKQEKAKLASANMKNSKSTLRRRRLRLGSQK
jgi:KaiC/GvpD/RAD55 family RecA-like ATPase